MRPVLPTAVIVPALLTTLAAQGPPQPTARAEFDVVSIKRNTSDTAGFWVRNLTGGQATLTNVTVRALLDRAYDITADTPIIGLPAWADAERYEVVAKTTAAPAPKELQQMWRSILVDRLKFAGREEMREQAVFTLVIARADGTPGTGLTPSTITCRELPGGPPPDIVAFLRQGPGIRPALPRPPTADGKLNAITPEFIADHMKSCSRYSDGNSLLSGSMTMAALAQYLTGPAERVVVDRTGLTGAYAIRMVTAPDDTGGSLFTALQEQLGLKLEPARAQAPALVIDHIERPSDN